MRALKREEIELLRAVALRLPEREQSRLISDIENSTAENILPDGSQTRFIIAGYDRPLYNGQQSLSVEGRMRDSDGVELTVLVYTDENGHLLELEMIRWGDGELIDPQWTTLKLV